MTTHRPAVSGLFHLEGAPVHASDVTQKDVILLDLQHERHADLRHMMLAMGFDVFCGARALAAPCSTLVIVDPEGFRRSRALGHMDLVRAAQPRATLCVVIGGVHDAPIAGDTAPPEFDDARAVLSAARIGFISEVEVPDARSAQVP